MAWTVDTLTSTSGGSTGSFAYDSIGTPHCVYTNWDTGGVYYMNKLGGSWTTPELIDAAGQDCDIAFDSDDVPHIALSLTVADGGDAAHEIQIWHYSNDGGGWSGEEVSSWTSDQSIPPEYDYQVNTRGVAICFDPFDYPHILFGFTTNLAHPRTLPTAMVSIRHYDGSTTSELFTDTATIGGTESFGAYVPPKGITCETNGSLHWCYNVTRSYYVVGIPRVYHSEYSYLYLDTSLFLSSSTDGVIYQANNVYLDPSDNLYFAYSIYPSYTVYSPGEVHCFFNSTDEVVDAGYNGTVVAASDGTPHMAYYNDTPTVLHATKVGASWSSEAVDSPAWSGTTVIDINPTGDLGIFFTYDTYMYFAHQGVTVPIMYVAVF